LAEKVTRLWNDRQLCRRLGRAARQKALDNWTARTYFEQLMNVYREVTAIAHH
jgi:glycosyltransferase involved in cell wall biosynthesis